MFLPKSDQKFAMSYICKTETDKGRVDSILLSLYCSIYLLRRLSPLHIIACLLLLLLCRDANMWDYQKHYYIIRAYKYYEIKIKNRSFLITIRLRVIIIILLLCLLLDTYDISQVMHGRLMCIVGECIFIF